MHIHASGEKCVEGSSRATLGATTGEGARHVEHADRQGDKCQVREVRHLVSVLVALYNIPTSITAMTCSLTIC